MEHGGFCMEHHYKEPCIECDRDDLLAAYHIANDHARALIIERDRLRAALIAFGRAVKHMPKEAVTPELQAATDQGREALRGGK